MHVKDKDSDAYAGNKIEYLYSLKYQNYHIWLLLQPVFGSLCSMVNGYIEILPVIAVKGKGYKRSQI